MIDKLSRDILLYGAGDVLARASVFLTLPIYTRVFSPQDYGVLNFVTTAAGLVGIFLALGGESTYARYFFTANSDIQKQTVTSSWLIFLSLWSSSLVLLCVPFAGALSQWSFKDPAYKWLFILALLSAPVTIINGICAQVLRNQFRVSQFVVLNVLSVGFGIGLSLLAVFLVKLGLAGVLGGTLVAMILMLPIRLWTARDLLRWRFSFAVVADCLRYGASLVAAGLAYWVFTISDRLLLGKLATLDEVGLYSVAATLVAPIVVLLGAFGQAWWPHALQLYETTPEAAPAFFGRVATYLLIGFGLLAVCISVFASEFLQVLAAPAFEAAVVAVPPLALGAVALATTQITAAGMSMKKKTDYIGVFAWLAAAINIGLNLLLIPAFGIVGSAWSTAASSLFLTVGYATVSQRLWPIPYDYKRVISVAVLVACFTLSASALPHWPLFIGIPLKALYCIVFVSSLFLFGGVKPNELQGLRSLITRFPRLRSSST